MHRKGDIRHDGKVFYGKNKNAIGGEYWMEMDHFLRTCGQDYYEKRDAYQKYLIEMSRTKDERALKQRIKNSERYHQTKHLTVEKRKESRNRSHAKMLLDPVRLEKHKAKQKRARIKYEEKRKLERKERAKKRMAESDARKKIKAEETEARRIARETKRVENEKIRLERLANKKPPITEEQRKEKKRQEKRNYKHTRRARMNNCEVRATPQMVADARKSAGDRCYYCGKKSELTLDHFEPLAKGGAHCVSNFVFACFSCNSRKRDLDPFDFMASNLAASF